MTRFSVSCALILWAGGSAAQGLDGRAERLLEEQLSGPGRTVEITGFTGAISTRASFERLTMSDDEGIWLTLENAVLDWTASALLRGRLQVDELSATRLELTRLPEAESDPVASSEASGFRIPDLPVVIDIGRAALDEISLGAPVLGTAVTASFEASARLESGGLDVDLLAERLDGPGGRADIEMSYAPGAETLRIDADIREPEGGVVARTLDLPGLPSVELRIVGDGVLDDFASTIRLATDGEERFGGEVTLAQTSAGARGFSALLNGDIRPLLPEQDRAFFGSNTEISASGAAEPDGRLSVDALEIRTAQLALEGAGVIGPDGAPERLSLSGNVEGALPGGVAEVGQARLLLNFDAQSGPDWTFAVQADALEFPGGSLAQAGLDGTGLLEPGTAMPFSGNVALTATGLALDDPAISQALGEDLTLRTDLTVSEIGIVTLSALQLEAEHLSAGGEARAEPVEGRIAVSADVAARVPDLGALGPIVAPLQAGEAGVDITASAELPGGAMEISVTGLTRGLDIGQVALTHLLEPETDLTLQARRDENGTRIDQLSLQNEAFEISGDGTLSTRDGTFAFTGILQDPTALVPELPSGALRVRGTAENLVTEPLAKLALTHEAGLSSNLTARLSEEVVFFDGTVSAPSLTPFAPLLGPVSRGSAEAVISGQANTLTSTVAARLDATTRDLSIGVAELDPLLVPQTDLSATVQLRENGDLVVDPVTLTNPELTARAAAVIEAGGQQNVDLTARLARPEQFLDGLPSGALRLTAQARDLSGTPNAELALVHDTGTRLDATARLEDQTVRFDTTLDAPSLAPFARLTGPITGGTAQVSVDGEARLDSGSVAADVTAQTDGLTSTIAQIAPLLRPQTQLNARIERDAEGRLSITGLDLRNPELDAQGSVRLTEAGLQSAEISAALTNLARIVPELPGRLSLNAALSGDQLTANLSSATGAEARVTGNPGLSGSAMNLSATGRAPLALAGPFIGNRALTGFTSFDLALRGAPSLSNISGSATSGDLRFSDPDLGIVLSPATARVDLSGGRAQINLQGALNDAPLEVRGGVALSAPFQTDLSVAVRSLDYAFQDFARLNLSADLTLSGAAQRQLAIGGDVRLGRTEIRVPDGGASGAGAIPPVRHVGAPGDVRRTLARAGLLGENSGGGAGIRLPLDLTIRAMEPIFVRGRGLDAEFGGALQVRGTVARPVPTGQFSLRRGRLSLLGKRLDLTRGEITATGGLIPDLDIVASTQAEGITAQVALRGPADAPELVLTSQPELPQDEVLARILFGRDVSSLSAFQVAQLVASLAALTSGRPSLLEQGRSAFGVDDLDIRTNAATGEAELAIGNYISENIYSEVEIGAEGDTQINLNLDITDNTKVRGSVSSEGNTGVGVFWERDY